MAAKKPAKTRSKKAPARKSKTKLVLLKRLFVGFASKSTSLRISFGIVILILSNPFLKVNAHWGFLDSDIF